MIGWILLAGGALVLLSLKSRNQPVSSPPFTDKPTEPPPTDKAPEPIGPTAPANVWTKPELVVLAGEIADEEKVSVNLVRAICDVESSWNPRSVNPDDPSYGLMGVQLATGRAYVPWIASPEDLYDPPTNIRAGSRFLKDLWNKWSDQYGIDGVIQMYNLGETRFLKGKRSPSYLQRVRARL